MQQERPTEPVPRSFRPFWVFLGLMVGVTVVIGIAAAVVALLVQ